MRMAKSSKLQVSRMTILIRRMMILFLQINEIKSKWAIKFENLVVLLRKIINKQMKKTNQVLMNRAHYKEIH